jgi:hypothetical protein
LKLFQELEGWGRIKENGAGGEFKCDIFDIVITFVNVTMYPYSVQ